MGYYYNVSFSYKSITKPHKHQFYIGIYSDMEKAVLAVNQLKDKEGFKQYPNGFKISKRFLLNKPKLVNVTGWADGFVTYNY